MKLKKEAKKILLGDSVERRKYLCEIEPVYFGIYYFPEYYLYKIPDFHYDFYGDIKRLWSGEIDEAAWIAFRESAKTSIGKISAIHAISYKKKNYINWDAYDKDNSEAALFDIVVQLQSNTRLIQDFGQLYYQKKHKDVLQEAKLKRISSFITENDVKVEAFSTQESTRGRIYKHIRPDLYIFDDVETVKTKDSYPITNKIIKHIDEARTGMGANGSILYLGNYITEEGVIENILKNVGRNPRGIARNIPVVKDKKVMWPAKYVKTNKEAAKRNKTIEDPLKRKLSLENHRIKFGEKVFETEFMNNPSKAGDLVFNRAIIKELLKKAKDPIKEIAGLKIWRNYNAKHRYGLGADTSEGKGLDANAHAIINYSTRPAIVVATFQDNEIKPNIFAHEIKRPGNQFGGCVTAPAINNTGWATCAELENCYDNIYIRQVKNKKTGKESNEFGIRMTTGVKYDIISNFVTAVEDGELVIWDRELLLECYYYKKKDLNAMKMEDGMTRHFDKLIGAAIAWELRRSAKKGKVDSHGWIDLITGNELENALVDVGEHLYDNYIGVGLRPGGKNDAIVRRTYLLAELTYCAKPGDYGSLAVEALKQKDDIWDNDREESALYIDAIGEGKDCYDIINKRSTESYPVIGGESADDPDRFFDRRSEMGWRLREWLLAGGKLLGDSKKWNELLLIKYKITSDKKIKIIGDEDLRKLRIPPLNIYNAISQTFFAEEDEEDIGGQGESNRAEYSNRSNYGLG